MRDWQQHIPVFDWIAVVDGTGSREVVSRVREHLATCPGCRLFHGEMSAVHEALRAGGSALGHEVPDTEAALGEVLSALRKGHFHPRPTVDARLACVVDLITPLCGARGVTSTVAAARKRLRLGQRQILTEERWPEFLRHITATMASMCGDTAAELVWVAGME
jgi:anti-sigma factor RsiW